ncbi:MAG: hypothetical protein ACOCXM_05875 [Myxococcota bacterium]
MEEHTGDRQASEEVVEPIADQDRMREGFLHSAAAKHEQAGIPIARVTCMAR